MEETVEADAADRHSVAGYAPGMGVSSMVMPLGSGTVERGGGGVRCVPMGDPGGDGGDGGGGPLRAVGGGPRVLRVAALREWLLSDHPLAEAERRRRREASFARRAVERARVREITGRWPADAPEGAARLRESMGRVVDGQEQRDRWDRAVDEEIGLETLRVQWETHRRVSGDDPDYRYPDHYRGPGAGRYPPPPPAAQE